MKQQKTYLQDDIYIDGNTARRAMVEIEIQEPVGDRKKRINKRMAPNPALSSMSPVFAMGIVIAVAIILCLCVDYVQLQTDIKVRLDNINSMEAELANLISENKALEKQVSSYIDLDYVYDVATTELGMRYPSNGQVVYYESTNSEYVRQYGTISENGAN